MTSSASIYPEDCGGAPPGAASPVECILPRGRKPPRSRRIRRELVAYLKKPGWSENPARWPDHPYKALTGPLFGLFCHDEALVRWRAISALGILADELVTRGEAEPVRVIMRRIMWTLNDESGGIGWGAPEAMGDITARNKRMAAEFHRILISYVDEDGNYLEHPVLQRGVLWGLARLSAAHPELMGRAEPMLHPFLRSDDPYHRGLAALAAGPVAASGATRALLKDLVDDASPMDLYTDGHIDRVTVGRLAGEALSFER